MGSWRDGTCLGLATDLLHHRHKARGVVPGLEGWIRSHNTCLQSSRTRCDHATDKPPASSPRPGPNPAPPRTPTPRSRHVRPRSESPGVERSDHPRSTPPKIACTPKAVPECTGEHDRRRQQTGPRWCPPRTAPRHPVLAVPSKRGRGPRRPPEPPPPRAAIQLHRPRSVRTPRGGACGVPLTVPFGNDGFRVAAAIGNVIW